MRNIASTELRVAVYFALATCAAGCDARVVERAACEMSTDCPAGGWCVSGRCVEAHPDDSGADAAVIVGDTATDGEQLDAAVADVTIDDAIGDGEDGVWDGGVPDSGPDVAVHDMCTGSRPDGGLMDVTPSCDPSPTGKGGEMCEVPSGQFWMGADPTDCPLETKCQTEMPFHPVTVPSFRIDKYEVTVDGYAECVAEGACTPPKCNCNPGFDCVVNSEVPGREDHPVNCVDWLQASTYCWWAGKRLPSEAEWEKAARGTDGRLFPWGNEPFDCTRAVLNMTGCGTTGTAPVGSRPAGASPYGIHDLMGNVYEWTGDLFEVTYYHAPSDGRPYVTNLVVRESGRKSLPYIVRGPGWDELEVSKPSWHWYTILRGYFVDGSSGTGFRCALSNEDGPVDQIKPIADNTKTAGFVGLATRVGGGAGGDPNIDGGDSVLTPSCGVSPTGRGGEMCEVPEGSFPMGCRIIEPNYLNCDYYPDEIPVHDVWLSRFKIDRFEVTMREYRECVEAGGCSLPVNVNRICNERCTYGVSRKEDHPINCVLWEQARDYCAWAGKRLPTEAEWEKAAGGPDGWFWPWGNDQGPKADRDYAVLHYWEAWPWSTFPVGTKPKGATPYGALDMLGNVWEWTNDWYDESYYANSPAVDPQGPPGGYVYVLRGFANEPSGDANIDNKTRHAVFHPAYWSETVGFRCAY
jgi:formylglycine-generating enzyme required for sulfatase activity